MKYYVLGVWCDVDPFLSEQYDTEKERDNEARRMRKEDDEMEDSGIYRLDIDENGIPSVSSYLSYELNPKEKDDELNLEF